MGRSEVSLLEAVRGSGVEAAILTSYSCHFPYLEEVIVRQLRRAGVRQVIILADRAMLGRAVQVSPPRRAGRDYALLPVERSAAFHPKVALLVGKRGGVLSIGSNNLTLAGYSWNKEVAALVRTTSTEAADTLFTETWGHLKEWMALSTVSGEICQEETTAFEEAAPWLREDLRAAPETAVAAAGGDRSLWEQVVELIEAPVERVTVVGAFFDSRLDFIGRLQEELVPLEVVVGVEPQTVSAPPEIGGMEGVRLVDATKAWGFCQGYLHAKCLLIEDVEGGTILATGSANPSRPAWLECGDGANVEMVLIQRGDAAKKAAAGICLYALKQAPALSVADVKTIGDNWKRERDTWKQTASEPGLEVASFSPDEPAVDLGDGDSDDLIVLLDGDGEELHLTRRRDWSDEDWTPQLVERTQWIQIRRGGRCVQVFLLQRHDLIRDIRRPPDQRRFREALGTLGTDAPDLAEVFGYIEKLMGANSEIGSIPPQERGQRHGDEGTPLVGRGGRKRKRLWRLRGHDNLGYLLDVLMRELGRDLVRLEEVDRVGSETRSEEEQVGGEDEGVVTAKLSPADRRTLIDECHRRVKRLLKRMCRHLEQFRRGEEATSVMLVRLVAVLGMVHALRSYEDQADWVPKGQTTLPFEERWHLLREVLTCVVEGDRSLVTSDGYGTWVLPYEEWWFVRSYMLWLAFYCGCDFRGRSRSETEQERRDRLWENAVVVTLAFLVGGDKAIVDRARELIGEDDGRDRWLETITRLDTALRMIETPEVWEEPGANADLQIAALMTGDKFLPRLVYGMEGDSVEMTYFGRNERTKKYKDYGICTADLSRVIDVRELEA